MSRTILSVLLGIGGMFGWGIYDFLGAVFAKQIGSFKSLFWSQLSGFLSLLVLAFVLQASFDFRLSLTIWSALAAIIYAVGYLLFFRGFEIGNVSIVAATMNLWAVFTMLFAFLFLGQRLSPVQTVGVLLIIGGATLASIRWEELRAQRFQLSGGVKETVWGALLFGVFWNLTEMFVEQMGWLLTTLSVKLGIVLFLFFFSLAVKREIGVASAPRRTKAILPLMGMIEASAVTLVNYGLMIGDAILITPISSALSVITIALAIVFLKERVSRIQAFGMFLAVLGILLTAF